MSYSLCRGARALAALALVAFGTPILGSSIRDAAADPATLPKRGRAADGRAFRIDRDGMQITDYIAELEVTVDDLKRQVVALEDELDEKRARLERVNAGQPPAPALKETHLLGSVSATETAKTQECERSVTELRSRLAEAERRASTAAARTREAEPHEAEIAAFKRQLDEKSLRIAELERSLESVQGELRATTTRLAHATESLNEQTTLAEARAATLKSVEPPAGGPAQSEVSARASLAVERAEHPPEAPAATSSSQPSAPSIGDKASVKESLQRIQSLIIQRKDLSDAVSKKGRTISISLKPLVTRSGSSLDSLRTEASNLNGSTDVAALKDGIEQIEKILQEDIATLRRLKSL